MNATATPSLYIEVMVMMAQVEQYEAALKKVAWRDLRGRGQLRVTGPDRLSFLQGMVTQDVEKLAPGADAYAAMLTSKGSMVADLRVLNLGETLVLDFEPGRVEAGRDFLNRYLISEEAEIVDAPEYAVVGLLGPQAVEWAAKLSVVGKMTPLFGEGVDVLVERAQWPAVEAALGGVPRLSDETAEVLRVEAGVPRWGAELAETTIPLEADLNRAIHYQKGCYIGQEIIARATYRGQMNKKLRGLLLGDAEVAAMAELQHAGKKVGWVSTVVRSERLKQNVALGYVHRDHLTDGTELSTPTGAKAVVASLPWK